MLAKNLTFLAKADAAGIVLGARVPIILTSRADSVRARMASCAVAVLYADARRARRGPAGGLTPWNSILVINAGSSSLKFQVFASTRPGSAERLLKGQIDGIGARPRLRANGRGRRRRWSTSALRRTQVADVPAATRDVTASWLRDTQNLHPRRGRPSRRAWRPATTPSRS